MTPWFFNYSTFPASNRSDDPDGERTTTGAEGEAERDEMEVQNKEINNSEDDRKSTKSQKSSKSNLNKHEEEKSKGNENDEENSNDEASEEEEEEDKKWVLVTTNCESFLRFDYFW